MFRWAPYTFVRILIVFTAGIISGIFFPDFLSIKYTAIAAISLTLFYAVMFVVWNYVLFYRYNPGFIGLAFVALAGYGASTTHFENRGREHLSNVKDTISDYRVVITGFADERKNSWRMVGRIDAAKTAEWRPMDGQIMLYFSKADFETPFAYGSVLLVKGRPRPVQGPANPEEFDYRQYLAYKNIFHQHFLRSGDVKYVTHAPPSAFINASMKARNWANIQLEKSLDNAQERGIASALVLGITDGLDSEILSAYSATGAMHILAVSGLHISIIYLLIVWACKPLSKFNFGPWLLAAISLFILWGYAFLTGLSPSVLRAVTMFSFVAIAKPARQYTNIYNILCVSAFILLLFDPFLIMSVGFQLSYAAVLGIVYLQPRLYRLWSPKNYLVDETWKVTTVSIAAQIATLPLGFLYFHQFPNYFLITNLLAIPVSFVVLIAGLAVLVLGWVPYLLIALAWCLKWSIKILNLIVFGVEALPYAIIDGIYVNAIQALCLFLLIVLVSIFVEQKRIVWMAWISLVTLAICLIDWIHFQSDVAPKKMIVYSVPGAFVADFVSEGRAWCVNDSTAGDRNFQLRNARIFHGIPDRMVYTALNRRRISGGELMIWNEKVIVRVSDRSFEPSGVSVDYFIISNDALDPKNIVKLQNASSIILDHTNSYFYDLQTFKAAKEVGLNIYSVRQQGAFQVNL